MRLIRFNRQLHVTEVDHPTLYGSKQLAYYVSFCLMKNALRCESCHAQVTPNTTSCTSVHLTTLALVLSDWSRNSASRSYSNAPEISSHNERAVRTLGRLKSSTYALENLLPPYILQPPIQLLYLPYDVLDFALVRALNLARLANCKVHGQLQASQGLPLA